MRKTDNNHRILFAKTGVTRTSSAQVTDSLITATYIADGEILPLTERGEVMQASDVFSTNYATGTSCAAIQFVARGGNELIYTPLIYGQDFIGSTSTNYDAKVEQVEGFGYNPTTSSGSIDVTAATEFYITVTFTHDFHLFTNRQVVKPYHYSHESSVAPTQQEVAAGLGEHMGNDEWNKAMQIERFTNAPKVILPGLGTVRASKGSNTVYDAPGNDLVGIVAGDCLALGADNVCYFVKEVITAGSAIMAVLDMPYQGASDAVAPADKVTLTPATDNWGFRFTGEPLYWELGLFQYRVCTFNISKRGFGSTIGYKTSHPSPGSGVYQQLAELEWMDFGFDGVTNRIQHPIPTPRSNAVSGTNYDQISFNYAETTQNHIISGTVPAPGAYTLAFPTGSAAQEASLRAEVTSWFASLPRPIVV